MATKTQTIQLMLVSTVKGQQVLTPVVLQLKGIGVAAQAAIPPVNALQNRLNSFSNIVSKSISNIRGTIVGLGTAMAIIGTVQMFKSTLTEAISFEREMANVNTILQSTDTTIQDLKKQVLALDGSLGSSTEQAKALYQALSTGVEPAKAVQFVADAAKFAKANLADLDQSTLLLATTMNTYGDRISSVSHLTDVFSETIRAGVITGEQLVASLGTVINTAATAGVSIEEVAAAVATLTSVGVPAQQATTALNQAMLGFISPSEKAKKAAKELNIELTATALARDGLVKSMQNLAKVTQKDIELTAELFGETRALKGVLALTGEQLDFFTNQVEKNKTGVDGLTDSMHKLQQESLSAQFETAVSNINKSLNEFWQMVIDKVTPAVVNFSRSFVNAVDLMKQGKLPDYLYELRDAMIAVGIGYTLMKLPAMIAGFTALRNLLGGTALVGAFSNFIFNMKAAQMGAIAYSGALSILGRQIGVLLRTPVVGITVLIYGADKVLELLRLIGDYREEQGEVALAEANAAAAHLELAKSLKEVGYSVDFSLLHLSEYQLKIQRMAIEARKKGLFAPLVIGLNEVVDVTAKAEGGLDEVDKKLQQLRDSFNKLINPSTELVKEIKELSKAGFTNQEILRGMYDEIIKAAKAEEKMGEAIDAELISWLQQALLIERNIKALERLGLASAVGKAARPAVFSGDYEERLLEAEKQFLEDRQTAIENFLDFQIRAQEDAVEKQIAALEELKEWEKQNFHARLLLAADFFSQLANLTQGVTSTLLGSISAGFQAYNSFIERFENGVDLFGKSLTPTEAKIRAWAGAVGAALGAAAQAADGAAKKILEAGSAIAMGFAMGGYWGAAIAAITVGVAALIKAFKHDWAEDAKKVARAFGFLISENLAQQLGAIAKETGNATEAILLNIDRIASETPVAANNVVTFIFAFDKALAEFSAGSSKALEVIEDLNIVLPDMLKAGTNEFGVLNNEMLAFIQRLKQSGVEVQALKDYLNDLFSDSASSFNELTASFGLSINTWYQETTSKLREALVEQFGKNVDQAEQKALDFFDKLVSKGASITYLFERFGEGIGKFLNISLIQNRQDFEDFFTLLMSQINEMQLQGYSLVEIFNLLGDSIIVLKDAAVQLGLRSDPAFKPLFQLFKIMKTEAAKDLSNVNTLLTSFANLGILTQVNFSALENIFLRIFKQFNKDGKISRAEMSEMVPTLARLRYMSEKYGFTLDKTTQKLINQAIAQNKLSAEIPVDPIDRLATVVEEKLVPVLERTVAVFEQLFGFDGQTVDVGININLTGSGASLIDNGGNINTGVTIDKGTLLGGGGRVLTRQNLVGVEYVHKPTRYLLHPGEAVLGTGATKEYTATKSADSVYYSIPDKLVVKIGDREFDGYVEDRMEKSHIAPNSIQNKLLPNA